MEMFEKCFRNIIAKCYGQTFQKHHWDIFNGSLVLQYISIQIRRISRICLHFRIIYYKLFN